jgi:Ferritin-like domain
MSDHDREREESLVIASADELLRPATRRKFVRMLGVGGSIVMLPSIFGACDDDDDPVNPQSPPASPPPPPAGSVVLDLRTDVGIFQLVQIQEVVEATFYSAVVGATNFSTLFTSADERELLTDLRNVEVIHRAAVEAALGAQKLPDFTAQFNMTTINGFLASRESIVNTARLLETQGLAALNGAAKYIKRAENLLLAGKAASVEGRHLAALRDIAPVPAGTTANTAFAGDDTIDSNGRDVKLEATTVLARVKAANIFNTAFANSISLTAPTAAQGTATTDYFPNGL